MANDTVITLSKGGEDEHTDPIGLISIPDLWHIAQVVRSGGGLVNGPNCADQILKVWGLAHDFKNHILES